MAQPRPRFSSQDAGVCERLGVNPADGRIECWFEPSDFATTPGGGAWETGVVTQVCAKRRKELYISFPTTTGEWAPWPEPIPLSETKWRPGWSRVPAGSAPRQAADTGRRVAARARKNEPHTARKRQRHDSGQQISPVASDGVDRRDVQEASRFVAPTQQLHQRPWLAGGATLRQALLDLQISATGRLAGAGNKLVGDKLPRRCWTCARPDWVFLPPEFDDDPTGTFRALRERQCLEVNRKSKPIVIHSRAVARRYARAVTAIKEPGVCPPKYRGRGRKLVILFDWKDREKVVERISEGVPVYINPLDPPRDPGHPCWGATCYFIELRADLCDTLVIPAGMMHFVLTVEDSALVCVELSSPIASELTASLQVVQTVRQLQELDPHKTDTYAFYDRWVTAGFEFPAMLHKGIDFLVNSRNSAHSDANGRAGKQDDEGEARKALEHYRQWLLKEVYLPLTAAQAPKGSSYKQPQPAASNKRRRAYERVYRHLSLALELIHCQAAPNDGHGCGNGTSEASGQKFPQPRPSMQVVMRALAKAEKMAQARAAKEVDSLPEWARDPSATERVTLYHTGMHLLTDDAYNDDRGQSLDDCIEYGDQHSKAATKRKPGQLVSGRAAGRLAAARFLADADDSHSGKHSHYGSYGIQQHFLPHVPCFLRASSKFSCDRSVWQWQVARPDVPARR